MAGIIKNQILFEEWFNKKIMENFINPLRYGGIFNPPKQKQIIRLILLYKHFSKVDNFLIRDSGNFGSIFISIFFGGSTPKSSQKKS